jgi:hypothetical protein
MWPVALGEAEAELSINSLCNPRNFNRVPANMVDSQPPEKAREPRIRTQRVECRIHSEEHDGLRPLIDRLVEPLESALRHVESGVNRRDIEGGNVAILGGAAGVRMPRGTRVLVPLS